MSCSSAHRADCICVSCVAQTLLRLAKQGPIMSDIDQFSVTVSRTNDGNTPRSVTIPAQRVTLGPDGILVIQGWDNSRSFSSGLWDGFEVKRLPSSVGADNA
jgi:hypothetical protein